MISVVSGIQLDQRELSFRFILASGPGGQNVNKVATAVQLRFNVLCSRALPEAVRVRLIKLAGKRMTKEGELVLTAKRFRTQERNRQEAVERLVALIQQAAESPKPRRQTSPSQAAKRRRLKEKQQRGERKRLRRSVTPQEE